MSTAPTGSDNADNPLADQARRARYRLIGVVAVGLVVSISLPWLFPSAPLPPLTADFMVKLPTNSPLAHSVQDVLHPPAAAPTEPASAPALDVPTSAPAAPIPAAAAVPAAAPTPAVVEPTQTPALSTGGDNSAAEYFVQLAALSQEEKVKKLKEKLTKSGYNLKTQKIEKNNKKLTRIMVGPYDSKKAEAVKKELNQRGFHSATVVKGQKN